MLRSGNINPQSASAWATNFRRNIRDSKQILQTNIYDAAPSSEPQPFLLDFGFFCS